MSRIQSRFVPCRARDSCDVCAALPVILLYHGAHNPKEAEMRTRRYGRALLVVVLLTFLAACMQAGTDTRGVWDRSAWDMATWQ
jgi:hypothetical protein